MVDVVIGKVVIINMTIGHICHLFFHGRDHYNLKVTSTAAAKMLNIFPRKGCIAEVIMMIMVVLVMRVVMIDGDHDGDHGGACDGGCHD